MTLSMELVSGDKTERLVSTDFNGWADKYWGASPHFEVSSGASWTLAWVLSRNNRKGHDIQAVEVQSGTCK
jgi:hypothetical protein